MNKQRGFSLVELMIAITLGLILTTGIIQVFLSSRLVYTTQQAMSRIQETGRLGMEFLGHDIRMAGFMGCSTRDEDVPITNTLNNPNTFANDFNEGIRGYRIGSVNLPAGHGLAGHNNAAPTNGTDAVVIRSAGGNSVEVLDNNNGAQLFVSFNGTQAGICPGATDQHSGICEGDILVVTDCAKARIFQATQVTKTGGKNEVNVVHSAGAGSPGNAVSGWGGSSDPDPGNRFGPGSDVIVVQTISYFIAPGISGRTSLWQNIRGVNQELLEGVQNMRLLYGFDADNNGSPDNYLEV